MEVAVMTKTSRNVSQVRHSLEFRSAGGGGGGAVGWVGGRMSGWGRGWVGLGWGPEHLKRPVSW